MPAATGSDQIAVVERGLCLFEEKAQAVLAAGGYEAMMIMNREGADACTATITPSLTAAIPTIFMCRDAGFDLFDQPFDLSACLDATQQQATIPIGTSGDPITAVTSVFDGWGYVRLFSYNAAANTLSEEDTFAIPEAMDPAFAEGYGDLSAHPVAVDPQNPQYAYLSYYAGGLRAIEILLLAVLALEPGTVAFFVAAAAGTLIYTSSPVKVVVAQDLAPHSPPATSGMTLGMTSAIAGSLYTGLGPAPGGNRNGGRHRGWFRHGRAGRADLPRRPAAPPPTSLGRRAQRAGRDQPCGLQSGPQPSNGSLLVPEPSTLTI